MWSNDFAFFGLVLDLKWVTGDMTARYEINVRAILGPESHDDKEVRKVHWEANQTLHQEMRNTSTPSSARGD